MRGPLIVAVTVALVVLGLLALDDVTTGSEPRRAAEWAMVVVTALWLALLGVAGLRRRRRS